MDNDIAVSTPPVIIDSKCLPPAVVNREYNVFFSPVIAERIIDAYIGGASLHRISRAEGMPSYGTLLRWAKDNDEFRKALESARAVRALHFEERAIEAAGVEDDTCMHKDDVPAARLKMDAAVWAAGVNDPAKYGKRTTVSGDPDKPLQLIVRTGVPDPEPHQIQVELGSDGLIKDEASRNI